MYVHKQAICSSAITLYSVDLLFSVITSLRHLYILKFRCAYRPHSRLHIHYTSKQGLAIDYYIFSMKYQQQTFVTRYHWCLTRSASADELYNDRTYTRSKHSALRFLLVISGWPRAEGSPAPEGRIVFQVFPNVVIWCCTPTVLLPWFLSKFPPWDKGVHAYGKCVIRVNISDGMT